MRNNNNRIILTDKAFKFTKTDFIVSGWTHEEMVNMGYAMWAPPAPEERPEEQIIFTPEIARGLAHTVLVNQAGEFLIELNRVLNLAQGIPNDWSPALPVNTLQCARKELLIKIMDLRKQVEAVVQGRSVTL